MTGGDVVTMRHALVTVVFSAACAAGALYLFVSGPPHPEGAIWGVIGYGGGYGLALGVLGLKEMRPLQLMETTA